MPPAIFTDARQLANVLNINLPSTAVIGIDGWTGIGKTTLGRTLAEMLKGACFDLDSAVERQRGHYVAFMRIDEVWKALSRSSGRTFVSGICLREVLAKAHVKADAHIYIKRMASWGWGDEDELEGDALASLDAAFPNNPVRDELRQYHKEWEPHLTADFEFRWSDT
jgi:putative protein kinase ArgK-like GTPase of G3E family